MDKMNDPASAVSERDAAARPDRGARPASFEAFFEAEHARLLRALYLVTGNVEEAEEVTQDAFLSVWERWDRVDAMEDPTGYLFRTAMNRFRSRYRRAARAARRVVGGAEGRDAFAEADERDALARALAALPARQRAAIVLTELLGYGSEEAGRILGVKDVTVRSLASQARGALRTEPGGYG
jgi:RNA polymerase sigma factor (sigma-70 family)